MHDVLRTRVLRKLESLPEDQVYQVLDYIEFLESKYAPDLQSDTTALQSFAEKLEDQLRRRTVSPASLREAFQLISAADKVLSNVANLGKELIGDLNGSPEDKAEKPRSASGNRSGGKSGPAPGTKSGGKAGGGGGGKKASGTDPESG
ncbi:MAG: DUF2281 domain-containing protein [Gemmatimonadetes bacterium]|nr:DUF2281 domain-containing protein [Gemmatimonadota bacterium]NNM05717.1 DUF2281 domain-containing protein [Gemmatimonadota bacterium]